MSDKKQEESTFSNEDTLVRRAWIDSALTSVRSHLDAHVGDSGLYPVGADSGAERAEVEQNAAAQPTAGDKPRLYVAWSSGERRSGT
jgi:hypothetical protein